MGELENGRGRIGKRKMEERDRAVWELKEGRSRKDVKWRGGMGRNWTEIGIEERDRAGQERAR